MSDYNQLPQYELPEIEYLPDDATFNDIGQAPRRSSWRGCFFLTPVGCIIGACVGAFACMCLMVVGPVVGLGALLAVLFTNQTQFTGTEQIALQSNEIPSLQIDDSNIDVTINGADIDEVRVTYTLTVYGFSDSDSQSRLDQTEVLIEKQADSTIRVDVDTSALNFSFYDLTMEITVPMQMNRVDVRASDVYIEDVAGDFAVDGLANDIFLADVIGSFDVTNGGIGAITFRGTVAPSSQNRFETALGDMNITFQGKTNLIYNASTGNGTLTCPDDPTATTACTGRYGDATAQVDLISDSGDIDVRVRQDVP